MSRILQHVFLHPLPLLLVREFFYYYSGNESPLEQYINNTGLMWELAPEFGAQVIFVEHRYEGQSLPSPSIQNCLSYSSSKQAIEDYAHFLEYWLLTDTGDANNENNDDDDIPTHGGLVPRRPVIAFGGSYGGMLSAWFRQKYPQLVTGAIAASAPVWALPRTNPTQIDGSYQILKRGLQMPYPPTDRAPAVKKNYCVSNLLAAWPLMKFLAEQQTELTSTTTTTVSTFPQDLVKKHHHHDKNDGPTPPGLAKLTEWFRLCQPLQDVEELSAWARTPWFDMAEGSFPYASSYIPFALIKSNGTILKLPPWPMQAACWDQSQLFEDKGVRFDGDRSDVKYNVTYGDSGLSLSIDWNAMTPSFAVNTSLESILASPQIEGLMTSVRDAVAVWYNITKHEPCFNLTPANNLATAGLKASSRVHAEQKQHHVLKFPRSSLEDTTNGKSSGQRAQGKGKEEQFQIYDSSVTESTASVSSLRKLNDKGTNATALCEERISDGSWGPLCCNENMNLIVMEVSGMGRDMFWPPTYPRGTVSHADVIKRDAERSNATVPGFCLDPKGIFGYSQQPVDPWSTRLDTYYGGTRMESFSNIVFSNGLLDPWTAGGVNVPSMDELNPGDDPSTIPSYKGPVVRQIGAESQNMIALMIEFGGHHTDLMYSDEKDPECVTKARNIEKEYIAKWIKG